MMERSGGFVRSKRGDWYGIDRIKFFTVTTESGKFCIAIITEAGGNICVGWDYETQEEAQTALDRFFYLIKNKDDPIEEHLENFNASFRLRTVLKVLSCKTIKDVEGITPRMFFGCPNAGKHTMQQFLNFKRLLGLDPHSYRSL